MESISRWYRSVMQIININIGVANGFDKLAGMEMASFV